MENVSARVNYAANEREKMTTMESFLSEMEQVVNVAFDSLCSVVQEDTPTDEEIVEICANAANEMMDRIKSAATIWFATPGGMLELYARIDSYGVPADSFKEIGLKIVTTNTPSNLMTLAMMDKGVTIRACQLDLEKLAADANAADEADENPRQMKLDDAQLAEEALGGDALGDDATATKRGRGRPRRAA